MDEDAVNEQVPDWNADMDAEWERQMQNAMPEGPSAGAAVAVLERESITLNQALGLPEDLKDLWPGHCYIPPRMKDVERLTNLANTLAGAQGATEDEMLQAMAQVAENIKHMARRVDGEQVLPVTEDDVKEEFSGEEMVEIFQHILTEQGVIVEGVQGKTLSGRSIGVRSFHCSAASIESPPENGESSQSDSTPQ